MRSDPVQRHLGSGPRRSPSEGEPRLPRAAEGDRRARRLRARRHLAVGPAGTGKTLMAEASAGETGKPYVFVDPQRVRADLHRCRPDEDQAPVPQAPQTGPALRRCRRVLRRGRRVGQPRADAGGFDEQRGSRAARGGAVAEPAGPARDRQLAAAASPRPTSPLRRRRASPAGATASSWPA